MSPRKIYFVVGALAIAFALFSCRDENNFPEETSEVSSTAISTTKLAEPPLRRSTSPFAVKPILETKEAGPQGNLSEFHTLVSNALENLPQVEQMRKNPRSDSHFSPPELMAASPTLGKVATALRESPELIPQGIEFYSDCTKREGTLTAVRVLCLRNLRYWVKQQPDVMQLDPRDFPEEIWNLADSLPPVVR